MNEKMNEGNSIDLNVKVNDINLHSLMVNSNDDDITGGTISRENNVEIISLTKSEIVLETVEKIYIDDLKIIELKMRADLTIETNYNGSEDELKLHFKENINQISYPLLAEASLTISFITGKKFGTPYIVPPIIKSSKK
ncbi:hypothetical protein ACFFJY_08125 [Fictibacillus aquaticus]|uniref:Uncharacterized protein n=1 Tax=Fictibacillus aquaticus TaxID=2021314 RepID=A0A235F960_9BACL|nr:hypothetical protein [Fictibacillus aquaticus]OYD57860.1 hypothetical protein CGZ90_08130 [Fictibacillus aquaticus]